MDGGRLSPAGGEMLFAFPPAPVGALGPLRAPGLHPPGRYAPGRYAPGRYAPGIEELSRPAPATETRCPPALPPGPSRPAMSDLELIARTVWGEARTAPVHGQEAIASVILNRRAAAEFGRSPAWGRSIRAVCLAPRQFACWTPGHPNRNLILTVGREDPVFIICRRIARRALAGTLDDRTAGATHYHPSTVFPSWATGQVASAEIGGYLFYNTIVNP